jgi:hypothetical protein
MKEHGAALDAGAMVVEARVRARIDARISGVLRDQLANRGASLLERYTRSSRRMRV